MQAGDRLSHYEVIGPIGAGGMGEVHRARDTRLDREVALKILPDDFAADPERLARFRREAKLLAALNHTNIASIHGIEEDGGKIFLAMELAPGETLAETVDRGALPPDDALRVAVQIAAGLEAAHEKGIVHRDLKPANVKLGPDGQVKILDFGLARAYAGEDVAGGDPGASPTLTAAMTRDGMILGTAAYMSPEQARGREVDSRTDIWAFGVILWELLGGRRLFAGETISDTLAMVLRNDPDWETLPSGLPPSLRRLLKRCLQKDRRRRLHHIADARIVLEEILVDGTSEHGALDSATLTVVRGPGPSRWPWALVVLLVLITTGLAWRLVRQPRPAPPQSVAAEINLPDRAWISSTRNAVAVSPDGAVLVCTTVSDEGDGLWRRRLAGGEFVPIPGTEDGASPTFSPDGRWILFTQEGRLRKIPREGGTAVDLCEADWGAGAWTRDGRIVFTRSYAGGLDMIPVEGGTPVRLTTPDMESGELGHWWPDVLPGGEWIIYTSWSTPAENARIVAFSLESGEKKELIRGGMFARWVPTGQIVFLRGEQLMSVSFDPSALEVTGAPVLVVDDVYANPSDGFGLLDFSDDGTLVYAAASIVNVPNRMVWVDRQGEATAVDLPARRYDAPRVSPDGRQIAVTISEGLNRDVWLCSLERGTASRFTFGAASEFNPVWSPDGRTIIFNGEEPQFTIYSRPVDGSAEPRLLLREPIDTLPTCVSPDGRWLVHTRLTVENDGDIWIMALDGGDEARTLVATPFAETKGMVSPDGRWLAYVSNESGRNEVYAIPFPDGSGRVQVSVEGGTDPFWSPAGGELFFRNRAELYVTDVASGPEREGELPVGRPRVVFSRPYEYSWITAPYSPADDAERFLMVDVVAGYKARKLQIVTNWFTELERKTAEGR